MKFTVQKSEWSSRKCHPRQMGLTHDCRLTRTRTLDRLLKVYPRSMHTYRYVRTGTGSR